MFISAFPQVLSCKTANVIPRLEWFLGHTDVSIRIWMLPLLSSYQGVLFSCWESLASVDGRSWTEYRHAQSKKNSGIDCECKLLARIYGIKNQQYLRVAHS